MLLTASKGDASAVMVAHCAQERVSPADIVLRLAPPIPVRVAVETPSSGPVDPECVFDLRVYGSGSETTPWRTHKVRHGDTIELGAGSWGAELFDAAGERRLTVRYRFVLGADGLRSPPGQAAGPVPVRPSASGQDSWGTAPVMWLELTDRTAAFVVVDQDLGKPVAGATVRIEDARWADPRGLIVDEFPTDVGGASWSYSPRRSAGTGRTIQRTSDAGGRVAFDGWIPLPAVLSESLPVVIGGRVRVTLPPSMPVVLLERLDGEHVQVLTEQDTEACVPAGSYRLRLPRAPGRRKGDLPLGDPFEVRAQTVHEAVAAMPWFESREVLRLDPGASTKVLWRQTPVAAWEEATGTDSTITFVYYDDEPHRRVAAAWSTDRVTHTLAFEIPAAGTQGMTIRRDLSFEGARTALVVEGAAPGTHLRLQAQSPSAPFAELHTVRVPVATRDVTRVDLGALPAGTYTVTVEGGTGESATPSSIRVVGGEAREHVVTIGSGGILIRVAPGDGERLPAPVWVSIEQRGRDGLEAQRQVRVDLDGQALVRDVDPGRYVLRVSVLGGPGPSNDGRTFAMQSKVVHESEIDVDEQTRSFVVHLR